MNNFNGIIEEYNNIAVDCFDGESLKSTAFFLSHCHSDHMKGLGSDSFFTRLKSCSDIKLYCSKVTSDLLVGDKRFNHLKPFMATLEVQEPCMMEIPAIKPQDEVTNVLVTLLPAGHCPGSVMFLFEGDHGTVLYTGDFRLTKTDLQRMDPVFKDGDRIKHVDKLYIDTTFCTPDAMKLPQRRQSRDALFEILDPWLANSRKNVVYLSCPAQFGCEYLFVELNKRYDMKVHVWRSKLWKYEAIPEIMESVTVEKMITRLHACGYKTPKTAVENESPKYGACLPCEQYTKRKRRNILYVRFSTMWFTSHNNPSNGLVHCYSENSYRICYSMHSSCEEISEFVQYFKPKSLHVLVIPLGSTLENVHQILQLDPEQLSSLESMADNRFGSLKNEALLSLENSKLTPESDLIFTPDSQLQTPAKKRSKLERDSHSPNSAETPTECRTVEPDSCSRSGTRFSPYRSLSSSQEFDYSPAKNGTEEPAPEGGIPKWTFEISPCRPKSQDTLCSTPRTGKLTPERGDPKWTFEISPTKDSCSALGSQDTFGSDYASTGRRSRASSTEQETPGETRKPVLACGNAPRASTDAKVNLMSRLELKGHPNGNVTSSERSTVDVIDLTVDETSCGRMNSEDCSDWDSTPELDAILSEQKQ